MAVKIGHAVSDENKKAKGGKAGDQTAVEVCTRNWYLAGKGWVLFRPKSSARAEKIAKAMEMACKNPHIGYDQSGRETLFNNVKTKGYNPSKTTKPVETDCSGLVRVCISYAYGKDVTGNFSTASLPSKLVKTGYFTKYTSDKYCKSSDYLRRGDILCTPVKGHTAVVLSDGDMAYKTIATAKPKEQSKLVSGTYITTGKLNMRHDAGTSEKKMILLPKGAKVKCDGSYSIFGGRKWLYVTYTSGKMQYIGFCSTKYLSKVK